MSSILHSSSGHQRPTLNLKTLTGAADRIGAFTLPFLVVGVALNIVVRSAFAVGGPPRALQVVSAAILAAGLVGWAWSVVLIVQRVPRGELITTGPYRLVKHPLYAAVALLVLPWLGFLLNSWLGVVVGATLYLASRRYAPREEADLSKTFGVSWDEYSRGVKLPWL
jgi:protein-S-isoprenylcysteine O-methyltransferase Ste14